MTENKRFDIIEEYNTDGNSETAYIDNKTHTIFSFAEENTDTKFINHINKTIKEYEQQIQNFKPIAHECISATSELRGKYESTLTSIGAFKEYLNQLQTIFHDFKYTTTKELYTNITDTYDTYMEYQLQKLNERYTNGNYKMRIEHENNKLRKENLTLTTQNTRLQRENNELKTKLKKGEK